MKKVQEFMTQAVQTVRPTDNLQVAAERMWEHDCGAPPVLAEDSRVVGMVTDRDVCMASLMAGAPLFSIPVSRAMSKQVFACRAEDPVGTAETTMREHQVRRLPVIDERSQLVGLLSINDIALEAAAEKSEKRREVTAEEVGMTLAGISRHREQSLVRLSKA